MLHYTLKMYFFLFSVITIVAGEGFPTLSSYILYMKNVCSWMIMTLLKTSFLCTCLEVNQLSEQSAEGCVISINRPSAPMTSEL